ncbi:hypothetical protein [Streptomyces sp. NPDC127118]|uniref:hypothetical protein n=1 Tax=Streptomyces sp. NPDC127118 TaxID=3345369 RepID=UPI00363BE3A2
MISTGYRRPLYYGGLLPTNNPLHHDQPEDHFTRSANVTVPLAGRSDINTTMGYNAIYPTDAIEAHRAFIARRRSLRPSEEYRTPTNEEWDAFLAHFEKRKLSLGTCARSFGTSCIHEHACFSELLAHSASNAARERASTRTKPPASTPMS